MPSSDTSWRDRLQPASFRGAPFKIEVGGQTGGRRNVTHEFPRRDVPFTEDLARRARRWPITGYVISGPSNPNYLPGRDALIAACEAGGAATLVHPTLGAFQVNLDTYSVTETRERGGTATFEMAFVEAGRLDGLAVKADTQASATAAANNLALAAVQSLDAALARALTR